MGPGLAVPRDGWPPMRVAFGSVGWARSRRFHRLARRRHLHTLKMTGALCELRLVGRPPASAMMVEWRRGCNQGHWSRTATDVIGVAPSTAEGWGVVGFRQAL